MSGRGGRGGFRGGRGGGGGGLSAAQQGLNLGSVDMMKAQQELVRGGLGLYPVSSNRATYIRAMIYEPY